MMRIVEGIPGQPHPFAKEIIAWAQGKRVQSRYRIFNPLKDRPGYQGEVKVEEDRWRDEPYANAGMPNWFNRDLEWRISPTQEVA